MSFPKQITNLLNPSEDEDAFSSVPHYEMSPHKKKKPLNEEIIMGKNILHGTNQEIPHHHEVLNFIPKSDCTNCGGSGYEKDKNIVCKDCSAK
jgi:hypothetical protein